MNWIVFTYSLTGKSSSSPRVALWRRLKRQGAVSLAGGAQLLPEREDCLEAFEWLAQEIRQAGGEAVVMHVQQFAGLADSALIQLFQSARRADYEELETEAERLEQELGTGEPASTLESLERLRRRHGEIARVDYFQSPAGTRVTARIRHLERRLLPHPANPEIARVPVDAYRRRVWVTRPHPHVDRLACIWLIRRFIDPQAVIRYAMEPGQDEIAFDMDQAEFGHHDSLCSFETMRFAFGLEAPGLHALAEIVHEIDLRDGLYVRVETPGVEAVLDGWRQAGFGDAELETHGTALFEGLYTVLAPRPS
ncbi:MAG TPA: chromate resistance protein ChrB domain-containing protein [Aggregatilineales bacterium]|nr:chromate resistance protein ChrB domain-containing protein [Aggregatilineales bacterium]